MAAPTPYYVDPAIAGNSGTGTIGDPFGDLQYALNTVTRDSTNGDIFHIKAGTSEVLSANLSAATYGTPTGTAPLMFRGYTSTAGDGGIGVIDAAATYTLFNNTSLNGVIMRDMRITNSGSAALIVVGAEFIAENCQFDTTSGSAVAYVLRAGSTCSIRRCVFKDFSGHVRFQGGTDFADNVVDVGNGSTQPTQAIGADSTGGAANISGNRVRIGKSASTSHGISYIASGSTIKNNTIWSNAGTGSGVIVGASTLRNITVLNNYIEGFSGTGGTGIKDSNAGTKPIYAIRGFNKVYNCATAFDTTGDIRIDLGEEDTLGSSGLTDAAGGDFSPTTAIDDEGFPASYSAL